LAVASVALALLLGFAISASIVRPVRAMETRMREIAAGDFDKKADVPNRDELGTLAADLNDMSEQLGRAHEELEAVSRHKSEFLANMSHELRTPLNAIIGFSEVLRDGLFGTMEPKQTEYVTDIHTSGHHLLSLINEILDLSKVESGLMKLDLSSFSVPTAIADALTLVRERASKNGVELSSDIDTTIEQFTGDEIKFKQIMLNLLSNAIKFTPQGGIVAVRAVPYENGVQISVSDTGIGIASEEHQSIFDAFQQGGGGHKPGIEGTGLGLSLTRRFVEMHDGRIWVESEISKGSTFSFTLLSQS
jgi:signal transduction histidine kinase